MGAVLALHPLKKGLNQNVFRLFAFFHFSPIGQQLTLIQSYPFYRYSPGISVKITP